MRLHAPLDGGRTLGEGELHLAHDHFQHVPEQLQLSAEDRIAQDAEREALPHDVFRAFLQPQQGHGEAREALQALYARLRELRRHDF